MTAAAVRIVTDRQGFMELARGHPGDRVQIEGDPDAAAGLLPDVDAFELTTSLAQADPISVRIGEKGEYAARLGLGRPDERNPPLDQRSVVVVETLAIDDQPAQRPRRHLIKPVDEGQAGLGTWNTDLNPVHLITETGLRDYLKAKLLDVEAFGPFLIAHRDRHHGNKLHEELLHQVSPKRLGRRYGDWWDIGAVMASYCTVL